MRKRFDGAKLGLLAAAAGMLGLMSPELSAQAQAQAQAHAQHTAGHGNSLDAGALVPLLQKGGYILLIRHERTEVPARADDYSKPTTDCMAQRNLSVAGYAGSQETGKALSALDTGGNGAGEPDVQKHGHRALHVRPHQGGAPVDAS